MEKTFFHVVFKTHKSRGVLQDQKVLSFLFSVFDQTATKEGFKLLNCKILPDQVHLFMSCASKHHIDYFVRVMKESSTEEFFKHFKIDRSRFSKLWGGSYLVEEIKESDLVRIINRVEKKVYA